MYINKIDDLIDKIIDDFYNICINKGKSKIGEIVKDINFAKNQKEINDIIDKYFKTINTKEIRDLVHDEANSITILNIIKRYIFYYLFLFFPAMQTNIDINTYTNNLLEFSNNQNKFPIKLDNFFTSENNAIIIDYTTLIKNIYTIINSDKSKLTLLSQKPEFKKAFDFLNDLGKEFMDEYFKSVKNKYDQAHNIIKTVIIIDIYKKNEKKQIFGILETVDQDKGEYIYIDVVIPTKKNIDYFAVENILNKREIDLTNEIWNYIIDNEKSEFTLKDVIDDKILDLIDSKIIVPICDDFLLYHKDTEKYDKGIGKEESIKKKEDTKVKYIINKLDQVADYYSENIRKNEKLRQEIKKNFYLPMIDRKAVLINNYEELKILAKFLNLGRKNIESGDFYQDLMTYREYAYANFKEFDKYGFSLPFNKTLDLVRSVSFEKSGDFKQYIKNPLQYRIGSDMQYINVVGFFIPTDLKNLHCLRVRDTINIRDISSEKNGYKLFLQYIQKTVIEGEKHKSSVYWLFDPNLDTITMDSYEQTSKIHQGDQIKIMINKLYDDILFNIYNYVLISLNKYKELNIKKAYNILKQIQRRIFEIPQNTDLYNNLEYTILYEKSIKIEPKYDEREDIFHGLTGEIIKLPSAIKEKSNKIPLIFIESIDNPKYIKEKSAPTKSIKKLKPQDENPPAETPLETPKIILHEAICQHNVTWDYITNLKKSNPLKYADLLYTFIYQYVVENSDKDFVCKSCGTLLNIKKFVQDVEFDDTTQSVTTLSMPLEIALEDIPEYSKYKIAIRNIDKLVEKIAQISGMPYFTGISFTVKTRRKNITKDVIDFIISNNKLLKKTFKERNDTITKLYGINKEFTNLFNFEFGNDIFLFSSKEKDYYKDIKHNNVISFIIIFMILELNDTQISFMSGDKKGICNYPIFNKFGQVLFDGLKIVVNNGGDADNISKYRVLCYMLYIVSCMITKYNMWHYDVKEKEKEKDKKKLEKKFNPTIQKTVIQTTLDVLNSILENSSKNDIHYSYEIMSSKYYKKLTTLFNLEDVFKSFTREKSLLAHEKLTTEKLEPIDLTGKMVLGTFEKAIYQKCKLPKYYSLLREKEKFFQHINNITNCIKGTFHDWRTDKKNVICKICNTNLGEIKLYEDITKEILINYKYARLQTIAQKYCIFDGYIHKFIYDSEKKTFICSKCHKTDKDIYTREELDTLDNKINLAKSQIIKDIEKDKEKEKKKQLEEKSYDEKVLNNLNEEYTKNHNKSNPYNYIGDLIQIIKETIGTSEIEEANAKDNIYLKNNVFIIDHDQFGNNLPSPIIITDAENKVILKKNHPFFKKDVLYYTNYKHGKIDIFYDAISLNLIGYKEGNKDYVLSVKQDKKMKINYSLYNKLVLMGYESKYIDIHKYIERMKSQFIEDNSTKVKDDELKILSINEIIRNRINNLKKVIYETNRFIYRVRNSYIKEIRKGIEKPVSKKDTLFTEKQQSVFFAAEERNQIEVITEKYFKKLVNINLYSDNEKSKHKVFKHWKSIEANIFYNTTENMNISDENLVNVEQLNIIDKQGNLLLYYFVTEIKKLIEYNENKFIRTNLVNFLIEFIGALFEMFNVENIMSNFDVKKFLYLLKNTTFVYDYNEINLKEEVTPDETRTEDEINQIEDDAEEAEALDVDLDFGDDHDYYTRNYELNIEERPDPWPKEDWSLYDEFALGPT